MAKATNYTQEQIATITAAYTGDNSKEALATIAASVGKTVPSVRAKLSSLGVYKVAEKPKTASTRVNKTAIVEMIGNTGIDFTEAEVEGLAKANKSALEKVLAKLTN